MTIEFSSIKPFVRYSRILDNDMKYHSKPICGYDSRLLYCTEGTGFVEIQDTMYSVSKGTLLIWKGGIPYRYCAETNPTMKFIALNFDWFWDNSKNPIPIFPDKVESFDGKRLLEDFSFSDAPFFNTPLKLENMYSVHEKLSEINREYSHGKEFCELNISGILMSVLSEAASVCRLTVYGTRSIADKIIDYLQSNYAENISNNTLGEIFGYHPNYLNNLFSQYTGKSLHRYLQDLRIMKAMALLQDSSIPISEICYKVGFCDFPHFSREFKKKTGFPPSHFRL